MSATKAKSKIHARNPEKRERQSATERFAEQLQKHVEFHQGSHIDGCCFTTKALPGKLPNTQDQQPRTKEAANMSDTNKRSVASDGSVVGEPVAWIAVFDGDDADGEFVWPDKGRAIEWASTRPRVQIAPLYLRPQPTLTDEEQRAIGWAAEMLEVGSLPNSLNRDDARVLRALLERIK